MALKVTKSVNFKRDNGSLVFTPQPINVEAPTSSAADQLVAAQVQQRIDAAQGNLNELSDVLSLLNS